MRAAVSAALWLSRLPSKRPSLHHASRGDAQTDTESSTRCQLPMHRACCCTGHQKRWLGSCHDVPLRLCVPLLTLGVHVSSCNGSPPLQGELSQGGVLLRPLKPWCILQRSARVRTLDALQPASLHDASGGIGAKCSSDLPCHQRFYLFLSSRASRLAFATALMHLLQGGQSQRVTLAIALALKPKFLLLDEPSSALDHDSTLKLEQVLKDSGCGLVWVTHDDSQPGRVGGRIIHLPLGDPADCRHRDDCLRHCLLIDIGLPSLASGRATGRHSREAGVHKHAR